MLFTQEELPNVLGFVSRFYTTLGERRVEVDVSALESVLKDMREHLGEQTGGVDDASPFKKAASFLCHFIESKPLKTPLPHTSRVVCGLSAAMGTAPDPNAVVGLRIAMESLHGGTLRRTDGKTLELSRRLDLSRHSYVDMIDTLTGSTPAHFKFVVVLLEQLAYKTNIRCQYPSYRISNFTSRECHLEPVIGHDELLDVWSGRARLEVVEASPALVAPDEVIDGIERARESGELDQARGGAPFHYRLSRVNADLVDRVAVDLAVREAAVEAAGQRERYIRNGRSFCTETVFSHPSKLDLVRTAIASGYEVNLIYIHFATDLHAAE